MAVSAENREFLHSLLIYLSKSNKMLIINALTAVRSYFYMCNVHFISSGVQNIEAGVLSLQHKLYVFG